MATSVELRALKEEVLRVVGEKLAAAGLAGRKTDYRWPVAPGYEGRMVFNVHSWAEDRLIDLDPYVGVRCEAVERVVRELMPPGVGQPPSTVGTGLWNLMPRDHLIGGRSSWGFQPFLDLPGIADHLVAEFEEHGRPWVASLASLRALLDEPREGLGSIVFGGDLNGGSRRAIVLWLLGDPARAERELDDELPRFGSRDDEGALGFRVFAERMRERLRMPPPAIA